MLLLDGGPVVPRRARSKGDHALSALISAISALQRQEIPVGLVMCGLPTLTGNLLRRAHVHRARCFGERLDG